MLTINQCKDILEENSTKKYTDEEVKQIRYLLYKIGHLEYELLTLNKLKNGKSNIIHESVNG